MKLMKRAAVYNIPSQVRHCAVTPKSWSNFGRSRRLSEQVAQLKFGNKPGKCILYLFDCKPPLTTRTIEGDLHFFLSFSKGLDQGLKDSGRIWPAMACCAGRNAFWEFSNY